MPFDNTPDPRFFYLTAAHEEALAALNYGVNQERGATVITGAPGCGKTLLGQMLVRDVQLRTDTVTLSFTPENPHDLLAGICRELALASGHIVVNVDYALAPEFKFPWAIEETVAVGRFLRALGPEWGIDPARLSVGGDSAGAGLSMGALLTDRALFQAAWLVYGSYTSGETPSRRLYSGPAWGLTPAFRDFYRGAYYARPEDALDPRAAACNAADLAGLPPMLLAPAELDPLRDDSYLLAERLRAAGGQAEVIAYLGCYHGFLHMTKHLGKARQAVADGAAFLRRVLGD